MEVLKEENGTKVVKKRIMFKNNYNPTPFHHHYFSWMAEWKTLSDKKDWAGCGILMNAYRRVRKLEAVLEYGYCLSDALQILDKKFSDISPKKPVMSLFPPIKLIIIKKKLKSMGFKDERIDHLINYYHINQSEEKIL